MITLYPKFAEEQIVFFRNTNLFIKDHCGDILADDEYLSKSVPEVFNVLFYKVYTPLQEEIESAIRQTETATRTIQQPDQLDVLFTELHEFNNWYQNIQCEDREEIIDAIQQLLKRILDVIVKLSSWIRSVLLIFHAMLNMFKEALHKRKLG